MTNVFILVEFHVTPKDVTQFLEEATIMKDFTHQHVLHLLGVAIDDDRVYVVLPYMENGDLKSFISNDANVSGNITLQELSWGGVPQLLVLGWGVPQSGPRTKGLKTPLTTHNKKVLLHDLLWRILSVCVLCGGGGGGRGSRRGVLDLVLAGGGEGAILTWSWPGEGVPCPRT